MDGLNLLRRAREAGLAVQAEGDKLVIRGPKHAEPVARLLIQHKQDVVAALARIDRAPVPAEIGREKAAEARRWRDRYAARIAHWSLHGQRGWQEAERLAFGELTLAWHRRHGARPDPGRCAGCGDDLPADGGLIVDHDCARVHFDGARGIDCITAYGARWRSAAVVGLCALGIDPPEGFDLL